MLLTMKIMQKKPNMKVMMLKMKQKSWLNVDAVLTLFLVLQESHATAILEVDQSATPERLVFAKNAYNKSRTLVENQVNVFCFVKFLLAQAVPHHPFFFDGLLWSLKI